MTVFTIARNAFLEAIRQPIFAVLLLGGMLALVLNVGLAAFTLDDDDKLLVDLGLSTLFLCGLLLAAFTATSVLSREIDNRTVMTVVSKPVPRPAVVAGKYLGVAAALFAAYWSLAAVFLLTVRHRVAGGGPTDMSFDGPVLVFGLGGMLTSVLVAASANYLRGRPFGSSFIAAQAVAAMISLVAAWSLDKGWRPQNPLGEWNPQLMIAVTFVFEAVLVLAAVALAASTRLGQTMTLLVCATTFLAGLVSEYFLGTVVAGGGGLRRWLTWPVYAAIPNLQFFWSADALTQGEPLTAAHFLVVSLYAVAMIAALLSLAVLLFQRRDVG
jgi:ABC-2 type transport system permease protein